MEKKIIRVNNREFLTELLTAMYEELPETKKKR